MGGERPLSPLAGAAAHSTPLRVKGDGRGGEVDGGLLGLKAPHGTVRLGYHCVIPAPVVLDDGSASLLCSLRGN
jgi:hypothetical protein